MLSRVLDQAFDLQLLQVVTNGIQGNTEPASQFLGGESRPALELDQHRAPQPALVARKDGIDDRKRCTHEANGK
jgi:hypothetical protein